MLYEVEMTGFLSSEQMKISNPWDADYSEK